MGGTAAHRARPAPSAGAILAPALVSVAGFANDCRQVYSAPSLSLEIALNSDQFTQDEIDFLESQGLDTWMFFDARNLPKAIWEQKAKDIGANFVMGSNCREAGHRLRTRRGHCIQCNTARIAYQLRHSEAAFVYIAGSKSLGVLKVGVTKDTRDRLKQMNEQSYGGSADWEYLFHVHVSAGGKLEACIKTSLSHRSASGSYRKDGRDQKASEMFDVGISEAYQTLAACIQKEGLMFDSGSSRKLGDWNRFQ